MTRSWDELEAAMDAVLQITSGPDRERALLELRSQRPTLYRALATLLAFEGGSTTGLTPITTPTVDEAPALPVDRFEDLGPIGAGGMAEVRRVRDVRLDRILAMKILHASLLRDPQGLNRFVEEARATARLQHPNIVPVHETGRLPDGRLWFTMKEVRGHTLHELVREARPAKLPTLLAVFLAVCRATTHAHECGVLHRDLKPSNVMVGLLGEVYVLDWGLAKVVGRGELGGPALPPGAPHQTVPGSVMGTPAFMPPEQARGEVDRIDARSDVYSLGAILYTILRGESPFAGCSSTSILQELRDGSVPHLPATGHDPEVEELCRRALASDPSDRPQTAAELVRGIEGWLDGSKRRDRALSIVERALQDAPRAEELRQRASLLRTKSEALLRGVAPWQPESDKHAAWTLAEEAEELEHRALTEELEVDERLRGALQIAPDLSEANAALAERYQRRHSEAEQTHDIATMTRAGLRLRTHLDALPDDHRVRRAGRAYLAGDGALTLVTDPPGAEVTLCRYVVEHRRKVERFARHLGSTPLVEVPLPIGSYVCVIEKPGHATVRYPIAIVRRRHWDGLRPGDHEPWPIWLPPDGELEPDSIYVPAGWFRVSGDPDAFLAEPSRRLWCDALIAKRFPTTNRQYIAFLDDLVAQGREDEALQHVPRQMTSEVTELGAMLYGRRDDGTFVLKVDEDGDQWLPDWPVVSIGWASAHAFAAWHAERTGRTWRLPGEFEWEKAARGVDGRFFPWGDFLDPSWACMSLTHRDRAYLAVVDSFPVDTSPYGVRGLGGNTRDWCLETRGRTEGGIVVVPELGDPESRERRCMRGGAWYGDNRGCRSANRWRIDPWRALTDHGVRPFRRPPEATKP